VAGTPNSALGLPTDGVVTAQDALAIINYINAFGPSEVPSSGIPQGFGAFGPPFLDTTGGPVGTTQGNNIVTAQDALAVINWINAFGSATSGPEGESGLPLDIFYEEIGQRPTAATQSNSQVHATSDLSDLIALLAGDTAAEEQIKKRRTK
jgi:hypothetical protein